MPRALPGYSSPIDRDDLAALALDEAVESRLVFGQGVDGPWTVRQGPFSEKELQGLPSRGWTLLVQAADHWIDPVRELRDRFDFLPYWRIDDVMVSYAPLGGGVGPHFDFYDVFLLQGQGRRRWRIGQRCDARSALRRNTGLSILSEFTPCGEWVLEPGDMLYLPPGVAHWGEALEDSITLSIGYRAPAVGEIMAALAEQSVACIAADRRYTDPYVKPVQHPGQIDDSVIDRLQNIVSSLATDRDMLADSFGALMTEPKYEFGPEQFDGEDWRGKRHGSAKLVRHPAARFAYREGTGDSKLYVNGEWFECSTTLARLLSGSDRLNVARLASAVTGKYDEQLIDNLWRNGVILSED